jgi:hypothetical protein
MKFKLVILALLCGATLNAQTNLFGPGFSFDLFGAYSSRPASSDHSSQPEAKWNEESPQAHSSSDDVDLSNGDFGVGIGVNYFFTKNLGIGGDAIVSPVDNIAGTFINSASASAIVRLPLGRFAPYALSGATRHFNDSTWRWHAGAGVEARLCRQLGGFTEVRYEFASPDTVQFRLGVRVAFGK